MAAWRAFIDGSWHLTAVINAEMQEESGVGHTEYRILVVLSEHPELRMSELAVHGLSTPSTVSRLVTRLVEIGHVERLPALEGVDARNRYVRITPAGRESLHSAAAKHVRHVRSHLVDHLTRDELTVLRDVFEGLRDRLGRPESGRFSTRRARVSRPGGDAAIEPLK
ncbi:MarR family winged helix-turn-helix transcriptional regulator [Gordonia soli]|nr:MarR family transcriptional regulator [Gordonia soli]